MKWLHVIFSKLKIVWIYSILSPTNGNFQMKIESNQIKISGRISYADHLWNLKQGSRLSASIVERLDQKHAILNISGSLLRVEFRKSIPDSTNITLIFEKKAGNNFLFRIADQARQEELKSELLRSTVFNNTEIHKSLIYDLKLYIKQGINSIFALNKAFLGTAENYKKEKSKADKITDLFNKLLLKGLKYETLMHISSYIYKGNESIFRQFYFILAQIMPDTYKHFFKQENSKISEQIIEFTSLIDKSLLKDEKIETIRNILDIIKENPAKDDRSGEIIFFDDNKFKTCRYINYRNNILLSFNLSHLGNMDILIKDEKTFYTLAFYCEEDNSLGALKSDINILKSSLKQYGRNKFHINFYNSGKVIKKIIEINSFIDIDYLVDAKA